MVLAPIYDFTLMSLIFRVTDFFEVYDCVRQNGIIVISGDCVHAMKPHQVEFTAFHPREMPHCVFLPWFMLKILSPSLLHENFNNNLDARAGTLGKQINHDYTYQV